MSDSTAQDEPTGVVVTDVTEEEEEEESQEAQEEQSNSRGIPEAEFIEDVVAYLASKGMSAEEAIQSIQELYSKYKYLESSLVSEERRTMAKLPDMRNALDAIEHLQAKRDEEASTHFQLLGPVHVRASIKPVESVFLWLGAKVMLEFPLDEAHEFLNKNYKSAQEQLQVLQKDLTFLKNQITVSEVSIARLHNHNVELKAAAKKKQSQ